MKKEKAIQNYIDWVMEKEGERIKEAAIEMWLLCPDAKYWTKERMKDFYFNTDEYKYGTKAIAEKYRDDVLQT